MNPLISVIVPIYNVEAYLRECVDSILNQSYNNLEIILVDDGSPDQCGEICDQYAIKDNRIKVIHKENGGLSDSRNSGMKIATGDYYYFVDSDDVLPKDSVRSIYTMAEKYNADMVIGGFERFYDGGEVFFSTDEEGQYVSVLNKIEAMQDFFRDGCQAWAVLYRRKIHEGISFPKGEINEDEAIIFQLLERCETVVVTNMVVYAYRCRKDSITQSVFTKKKLQWVKHCKDNWYWLRDNYPELEDKAIERYRNSILWSLTEMILSEEDFYEEIYQLRKELKNNKSSFKRISFSNLKENIRFRMLYHCPIGIYRMILLKKRCLINET